MIKWRSTNGGVAQSGEHLLCKQGVRGSNPLTSTKGKTMTAENTEPICFVENSSINIEGVIESAGGTPEFKASLRKASVLLLPSQLPGEDVPPAFPQNTPYLLRQLKRDLGESVTVDAAIHDDNYAEFQFLSIDAYLPVIYVAQSVLLPLVVSTIGSYIAGHLKRGDANTIQSKVKGEIKFKGKNGEEFSLRYEGPANTYEKLNLQQIHELGSLLDMENPKTLEEQDGSA